MTEISSGVRLGVTALLVAAIVATVFFITSIGRSATTDYYDDQSNILENSDADLASLYNARVPVMQLCDAVETSDYNEHLKQIVVQKPSYNNGALSGYNTKSYTSITNCSKFCGAELGFLTSITGNDVVGYTVYIKVGV